MRPIDLVSFIDQSALRPEMRAFELDGVCDQVLQYRFRGLVVSTGNVHHAKRRLMDTGVQVVATVGFPHGNQAPEVKAHEAARAAALGADEVDYVISIGAALDEDWKYLRDEALAIVRPMRGRIVKAILEVGHLTPKQKIESAKAVADAGVAYVKTCTGFGPGEATPEDVALLVRAVEGKALVKASGGIRTREQVLALLQAGAAVIGTSRGPEICSEHGAA